MPAFAMRIRRAPSPSSLKLDDGAKLWAYLDDWYIWIKPQHITEAIVLISTATRTINLEL